MEETTTKRIWLQVLGRKMSLFESLGQKFDFRDGKYYLSKTNSTLWKVVTVQSCTGRFWVHADGGVLLWQEFYCPSWSLWKGSKGSRLVGRWKWRCSGDSWEQEFYCPSWSLWKAVKEEGWWEDGNEDVQETARNRRQPEDDNFPAHLKQQVSSITAF